jgi:hypothetical protein
LIPANRDPVTNMLGDRFATVEGDDNSIYRYMEEIAKEQRIIMAYNYYKFIIVKNIKSFTQ